MLFHLVLEGMVYSNRKVSSDAVAPESHRNTDDLRKLHNELEENIATRVHMIASDVAKSLDEVNQWFQGNPTQDSTRNWKLVLNNIQLAKESAMVSSLVYISLQF